MVEPIEVRFFRFDDFRDEGIVVFVADLAARHDMTEAEFGRHPPPEFPVPDFLAWCEARDLPLKLDEEDGEDNVWVVTVNDPEKRFEFRLRWGV